MENNPHIVLSRSLKLSAILAASLFMGGCYWHHHPEDRTVVVDEHGWRHEGFYDEHHAWHGGYVNDHGVHHDDPADWHH